ncbi:MAG: hypothetical protein ABI868_11360 [Acidobacteriota bacterium]
MRLLQLAGVPAIALALGLVSAQPALAQFNAAVTTTDVQRLQDSIYDANRDLTQLRSRDSALASQLERDLDEVRDDVVYLKVKLRKNESVGRSEIADVRDRIETIRSRARGDSTSAPGRDASTAEVERAPRRSPASDRAHNPNEIPVDTEFDVRLQSRLSSDTALVEDRFEATTLVDIRDGDRVLVPAGSIVRGTVSSVTKAGRLERKGSLTLSFDRITMKGRSYPIRATVTQALESEGIRGETTRIGAGAGVGAIIGGILGGVKGALAGILIGGGGVVAATDGQDVELPAGSTLRVRLDSPLTL